MSKVSGKDEKKAQFKTKDDPPKGGLDVKKAGGDVKGGAAAGVSGSASSSGNDVKRGAGGKTAGHQSSFIREEWIEQQLQRRVKEFTEEKKITVFMGSWNVNGKKPTEDLSTWLVVDPLPDVYCIGFQEIVDLNASSLLIDHNATKPWEDLIEKTLKNQYVQVCTKHLVGLSTLIYVKKKLSESVSNVQTETAGVGIMGVGGNKGGVVIRFTLFDSTICIVNAHLAAHKNNVQGRNSDFHNICNRIKFTDKVSSAKAQPKQYDIFSHDHLFWIGDLNYRLNLNDQALIYARIESQDWPYLLANDQLIAEKAAGNAFKKFKEGTIEFAPTYKYTPGTARYERREDKKVRLPAWCDRIQWIGNDIKQLWYRRAELCASDHKPVMSLFDVMVKMLIPEKKKIVHQSLGRQLDAWENECIPKVTMSTNAVVFARTAFDSPVTQTLKVQNTGQVVVQFHFHPKMQDDTFCKPWLHVTPEVGLIPPGESVEISLTVHIDRKTAQPLNTGQDTFDDILIFKVENGPDFFVTVSGDYLKSCFGSTVEYLCNIPYPVRFANPSRDPPKVLSLPKEMWRMVDFLFKNGLDTPGLFITTGHATEIERIRECLDTGTEFGKFTIHSMAEALSRFTESLSDPIFPSALCAQYSEGMNLTTWCMQALTQLTPAHYNAFIYMASFLREVLKHSDKNELTPNQLVLVFSRCLMHAAPLQEVSASGKDKPKSWIILSHFLTSEEFV